MGQPKETFPIRIEGSDTLSTSRFLSIKLWILLTRPPIFQEKLRNLYFSEISCSFNIGYQLHLIIFQRLKVHLQARSTEGSLNIIYNHLSQSGYSLDKETEALCV